MAAGDSAGFNSFNSRQVEAQMLNLGRTLFRDADGKSSHVSVYLRHSHQLHRT